MNYLVFFAKLDFQAMQPFMHRGRTTS